MIPGIHISYGSDIFRQFILAQQDGGAGVDVIRPLHAFFKIARIAEIDVIAFAAETFGNHHGLAFRLAADGDDGDGAFGFRVLGQQ